MMKINKINLMFGTLFCTVTLDSMLMTHSSIVHADMNGINAQSSAAQMEFDSTSQTDEVLGQTKRIQNIDQSVKISTVQFTSDNQSNMQKPCEIVDPRQNKINVIYEDLKGHIIIPTKPISGTIIVADQIDMNNNDGYYHNIPSGYILADGNEPSNEINYSTEYRTIYNNDITLPTIKCDNNGVGSSFYDLGQAMSERLYNAIEAESKSNTLIYDWKNTNEYYKFLNRISQIPLSQDYSFTLGFPTEKIGDDYHNYSDLKYRKPKNMCLVGLDEHSDPSEWNVRFADPNKRINIYQHDPELAKTIFNNLVRIADTESVNGHSPIKTGKIETMPGVWRISLFTNNGTTIVKHKSYIFQDFTNSAYDQSYADGRNEPSSITVSLIKPANGAQDIACKRFISLHFPNGVRPESYKNVCDEHGNIQQLLHFRSKTIYDTISGKIVKNYDWQPIDDTSSFPRIILPRIPGYTWHIRSVE